YRSRIQTAAQLARVKHPDGGQLFDVVAVDLIERTEAVRGVIAAVAHPILRFAVGIDQSFPRRLLRIDRKRRHDQSQEEKRIMSKTKSIHSRNASPHRRILSLFSV